MAQIAKIVNQSLIFEMKIQLALVSLLFFFLFGIVIHIGRLDTPIYDRHQFRQSDTYSMIYLFYSSKTDLFHPKLLQAPDHRNTNHYYLAEFPIYQKIIALSFSILGRESIVVARVFNIFFTAIAAFSITIIASSFVSKKTAYFSGILFNFYPAVFFWSRSITPDILGMACFAAALAIVSLGKDKNIYLFTAAVFYGLAVLIKPFYFAFLLLFAVVFFQSKKQTLRNFTNLVKLISLPIIMFFSWRIWIYTFPETARTDPSFADLMHGTLGYLRFYMESNWLGVFTANHFFGELLTPLGGLFSLFGLFLVVTGKKYANKYFILSWFLSSALITLVVASGSMVHDYYLLHWTLFAAFTSGIAFEYILEKYSHLKVNTFFDIIKLFVLAIVCGLCIYLLAIIPFQKHTLSFFINGVPEYYSPSALQDYKHISEIVEPDSSIITILPTWNPFVINQLRRFGYVFEFSHFANCKYDGGLQYVLNSFLSIEVKYIVLHTAMSNVGECFEALEFEGGSEEEGIKIKTEYEGVQYTLYKSFY